MNLRTLLLMRSLAPRELARLRAERHVQRGIRWLNRNAPSCWLRNCFDPFPNGQSRFRPNNAYFDQCILALAFEYIPELQCRTNGRVSSGTVATKYHLSDRMMVAHGFENYRFAKRNRQCQITSILLNEIWEATLRDPEKRHPGWSSQILNKVA
jgi:hypothetical protein